ncbi:cation:proton antiporter [Candidatus Aerophobetes bacterium]|uniref:Cation:proton antiporter n=1 Tax=Aerophobetes bacterium TaxID=2030807 RepID=A0A662DCS6_UNCAE|nr:cation:proton antiporter [Candidatus Aerophobetes bacterium]RLE12658.1 MAG: cation:proton antiporter [Candidatus Aerophobetes bacterium]
MTLMIFFGVIIIAVILALIRAVKGPTAPDRVVGVDIMVTITVALMVLLGIFFKRRIYLDVSLIYAVLSFVGVIAVARYLDKGL